MNTAERDRLLAAFALGVGRQTLPAVPGFGDMPPLAALALVGQSLRLTLPAPPAEPAQDWRLPDDPVSPLPGRAREPLLRLVQRLNGTTAPGLVPVLMAQIAASGYRLHPFDYPRLGLLLAGITAGLRPAEEAWRERNGSPSPTTALWRRIRALSAMRQHDPDQARTLLAAIFATGPVKARADLLGVLRTRLCLRDRPFLLAATGDGAADVHAAAAALLALLPESAAAGARAAAASFHVERAARLRLVHKPPKPDATPLQALDGVGLADLADALATRPDELAGMDAADPVRLALAACALRDGTEGEAAAILGRMQEFVWPGDLAALGTAFAGLPGRHDFAARVLRPADPAGIGGDWPQFCIQLGSPLAVDTAAAVIASEGWRNFLAKLDARADPDAVLLPAAILMPPALAGAFEATLGSIPLERRPLLAVLLAFLAELAALPPTEGT